MQKVFNELEDVLKSQNHLKSNFFGSLNIKSWKSFLAKFLVLYFIIFAVFPSVSSIDYSVISENIYPYTAMIFFITPVIYLFITLMMNTFIALKNPSHDFFKPIMNDISLHASLVNKFSTFQSYELSQSIRRLNYDIERTKGRIGFLVGAIEKLGIIPYCITLYFAFSNFFDKNEGSTIYIYALAFLFGLYGGVIVILKTIDKLEFFKVILIDANEVAEQRASLEVEADNKKA